MNDSYSRESASTLMHLRARATPLLRVAGPAALIMLVQLIFYPVPLGIVMRGVTVGLLTALIALGMALVYRANRVLNFAQADLGYMPAMIGVMLVTATGFGYFAGFFIGLFASVVLGVTVELLIIRRFFTAPRLILTVATIGLSQLLVGLAYFAAQWWHKPAAAQRINFPWKFNITIAPLTFNANSIIVWVITPVLLAAVSWFLTRTMLGAVIRASAERSERAALLGIPVKKLNSLVWGIAATLAFVALWLRAGVIGLPIGSALGLGILLRAIGALVVGRMTNLPAITLSAVALGVLETAVTFGADNAALSEVVIAVVILVALLLRRPSATRADLDSTSSWQTAAEVRRVPAELKRLPEVRSMWWALTVAGLGAVLVLPHVLSVANSIKASAVVVFAIVGTSIVVLTGWAGQVSLGQMGFVAFGGAITAAMTAKWHVDLVVALAAASAVGAVVAVIVGLPALRYRGFYLAVTTLAFALVTSSYLLERSHFGWVNTNRFDRTPLLGRISLESPTRMYYLAVGGLALVLFVLRSIRNSRMGRVLLALRENELAAQAYGIDPTRVKLSGFALSGAIAAFAGGLLAYHQHAFSPVLHAPQTSIDAFVSTVIGGLGTLWGGVIGAMFTKGLGWFLPPQWVVLSSAVGVLMVLMVLPSGLGGALFQLRDRWLRSVARQRGMIVPSLLADTKAPAPGDTLQPTADEPEAAA